MNKSKSSLPTVQWRPAVTSFCATLAVAGLLAMPAAAQNTPAGAQTDPVVAKVNGTEIKQSDLKAAEEGEGEQLEAMIEQASQSRANWRMGQKGK